MSKLSGGSNKPLTQGELKLALPMQQIFARQYHQAMKQQVYMAHEDFNWIVNQYWNTEIYNATQRQIGALLKVGGADAGKETGVHLTDFIDRPNVQRAIHNETFKFANSVNEATKDKLRETLSEAHAIGETTDEMTERIKTVFGFDPVGEVYVPTGQGDELENYRADRIARTESVRAVNTGLLTGYKESGVVQKAIWVTITNGCPFCLDMDGTEVDLNEAFWAKGDTQEVDVDGEVLTLTQDYGDVHCPPLHPNCRCTLRAKLLDIFGE